LRAFAYTTYFRIQAPQPEKTSAHSKEIVSIPSPERRLPHQTAHYISNGVMQAIPLNRRAVRLLVLVRAV
jgi:hypothetical protein